MDTGVVPDTPFTLHSYKSGALFRYPSWVQAYEVESTCLGTLAVAPPIPHTHYFHKVGQVLHNLGPGLFTTEDGQSMPIKLEEVMTRMVCLFSMGVIMTLIVDI